MKYLNPLRYLRRLKFMLIKLVLWVGIPLKISTKVDGFNIRFIVSSFIEYALRANKAIREKK